MDGWPGEWCRLLRPARNSSERGVLLGRFLEVPTHWSDDGLIPCWREECYHCQRQAKVRRRYYAPAQFVENDADGFAKVKPGIFELNDEHMPRFNATVAAGKSLRGINIKVSKNSNGKLLVAEASRIPDEFLGTLNSDFDVVPFLERFPFGMPLSPPKREADENDTPATLPFQRKQA